MISVIVPIYNRKEHLYLTLTALDCQGYRDFEVIVADDGSTDHPELVVAYFSTLNVKMITHEHDGFGANKCRNEGAELAEGNALVFLDSGILLNKHALQHYVNLYEGNGDKLIAGRYDWLPPMKITPADIIGNWQGLVEARLPHSRSWNSMELEGIIGVDPREAKYPGIFNWRINGVADNYCLELYGGNLLVPRTIFEELGGFDAEMTRHGGEDCEFAIRAQEAGYQAVFADEPIGYHMYHTRDQEVNELSVAVNIAYIRAKHDLQKLGIVDGEDEQLPLIRKEPNGDEDSNSNTDLQQSQEPGAGAPRAEIAD